MYEEDTIAAVATAIGEAGVAIVRVSGRQALQVGERVFRPHRGKRLCDRKSHTVTYGWIVDQKGRPVDEGLALLMKGPRSFTGEDVVEFHCHGGQMVTRQVLATVLEAGARLATPGEFTKRAFLNGRIDLSQAEFVAEMIRAKTSKAMQAAVRGLHGEVGNLVREIRGQLLEVLVHIEADIDFPELNLESQVRDLVAGTCWACLKRLSELLVRVERSKILRDGMRVVLVGRPNAGKSSLMNRLARRNRAIVTEIPGTTRDVIEEWINIHGLSVILTDTAGIRETDDKIEKLGLEQSKAAIGRADLVLVVVDAASGLIAGDHEVIQMIPSSVRKIVVANKIDLVQSRDFDRLANDLKGQRFVAVSSRTGEGISDLEKYLVDSIEQEGIEESMYVTDRQEMAFQSAARHLESAMHAAEQPYGFDLISIDIRAAWVKLGEITGETVDDTLIDQIFSRFCIGK